MNAIIALNPRQMAEAQGTTISWASQRIEQAQIELREAEQVAAALSGASLRRTQASNMISKARARLRFYEKVKAALEAGYYIVPPFPLQLFAIRVQDDATPAEERSERRWAIEAAPQALPAGEGRYVRPEIKRIHVDNETRKNSHNDGTHQVAICENDIEFGDVVLPVRALKPQIRRS